MGGGLAIALVVVRAMVERDRLKEGLGRGELDGRKL
jgi:hypothetical protein